MSIEAPIQGLGGPVIRKFGNTGTRARQFIFGDDFARESITPTGYPTLYTNTETGAAGTSSLDSGPNRVNLITDSTGAGDDQDMRTSGLRIDRNYTSLITGMTMPEMQTSTVQIDLPFVLTGALATEAFVGLHAAISALTGLPTTARHLGLYVDISVGANYMLSSSDGTAQTTVDTTIPVDTNIHILRITWTGEDAATLQLYTAAGVAEGTGKTVTAFNVASGASHDIHWFVHIETNSAKTMRVYPYRVAWT